MKSDLSILERLEKLERIVDAWKQKKTTWVSVYEIKRLTGWDKERMRRARANGEIEVKKKKGQIRYNLSSIHPLLIKQTA